MRYSEIAEILERFADGSGARWEWDDFMNTKVHDDVYLSKLQERLGSLDTEFPPAQPGHYCNPDGLEVILDAAKELRVKGAQSVR
jgi:hypothetical protein